MSSNMKNILKYESIYKSRYYQEFKKKATSWWGFQKWLADCNIAHTFQIEETKKCIELFEL